MKFLKTMTALALAAMGAAAHAGPTNLGTGPGLYGFADNHDSAWYVTLGPGTYSFSSTVSSVGFNLEEVWLSTSRDHMSNNGNDLGDFEKLSDSHWTRQNQIVTFTQATKLYIDIDTHLGKKSAGNFAGSFEVSAVPEPASSALLLAGVGLFGLMSLRRRQR